MSDTDHEYAATFEAQGRCAEEATGLPLVACTHYAFGEHCGHLVAEAQRIKFRVQQGAQSERRDAARRIEKQAAALAKDLRVFVDTYGYAPSLGDYSALRAGEMLAALAKVENQFRQEAESAAIAMLSDRGFAHFARQILASVFHTRFGQCAVVNYNPSTEVYSSPFLNFCRHIFEAAGVEISDAAIAKALQRKN
ncbi:hypothetical protein [Methylocystis sp. ATCC 49242]|uniref:hypothetical protein n=1 Tax=Methylocystis sp. ATCC 49242 TaxID=622637 RepID=UPI0001F86AB7|nr:hypothetical protein [Methylocystis sp. ATCC 49242]